MENTLVFIKPDGVARGLVGRILTRFEEKGLVVKELRLMQLPGDMADKHYQEHVEKPFYPELKAYVTSGSIVAMVLEGAGVVQIVRRMIGVTNAAEADSGTIRGDFATSMGENMVHASDSVESANREVALFFSSTFAKVPGADR
jgi:nucleoside-diphosphate kinase